MNKSLGNVQNPTHPTLDRAQADTLDLKVFDKLRNLKDKKVGIELFNDTKEKVDQELERK